MKLLFRDFVLRAVLKMLHELYINAEVLKMRFNLKLDTENIMLKAKQRCLSVLIILMLLDRLDIVRFDYKFMLNFILETQHIISCNLQFEKLQEFY